jgi:hypothetical protein
MFFMDLSPAYFAPVRISLLDADGALQEHVFDVQFVRFTQSQVEEFVNAKDLSTEDACKQVVRNWRHVVDAQGLSVPFSADNLDKLLKIPGMAAGVLQGFVRSWIPTEGSATASGQEAAEKN